MRQVVVDIPDILVELPVREQSVFVRAGLYEAQRAWVRQLETEIAESAASHLSADELSGQGSGGGAT
ncbi:MAG: hypothetical protein FJ280_27555 [Planctomycetes bacterium]|nr:hypothetical protein [Planctomycetota bacterium]